jgi:hypothetical protein
MGHAYTYDEQENLLAIRFWGKIPYQEEAEAVESTLSDPSIRPDVRIVVDRSEAEFTSTPDQVRTHIALVGKHIARLGTPTVANIVSADLDFGMVRMFEMMADDKLAHRFGVFRTVREACAWLGIDAAEIVWPAAPDR